MEKGPLTIGLEHPPWYGTEEEGGGSGRDLVTGITQGRHQDSHYQPDGWLGSGPWILKLSIHPFIHSLIHSLIIYSGRACNVPITKVDLWC